MNTIERAAHALYLSSVELELRFSKVRRLTEEGDTEHTDRVAEVVSAVSDRIDDLSDGLQAALRRYYREANGTGPVVEADERLIARVMGEEPEADPAGGRLVRFSPLYGPGDSAVAAEWLATADAEAGDPCEDCELSGSEECPADPADECPGYPGLVVESPPAINGYLDGIGLS